MLALENGGSCKGLAYRVTRAEAEEELTCVFIREMLGESYHARWLPVRTEIGTVQAISFVANRSHQNYAGRLPFETIVHHVSGAAGKLGTCRDYLINTVHHLEAFGIHDRRMSRLLGRIEGQEENR